MGGFFILGENMEKTKLFEAAYKSYKESMENYDDAAIELDSLLDNLNEYMDNNCNNEDISTSEAKSRISNTIAELDGMYANVDNPSDELSEKLFVCQNRLKDLCNAEPIQDEEPYIGQDSENVDDDQFSLIGTVAGEEDMPDDSFFEDLPDDDYNDGYGDDFDFGPEPYEPSPYNGDYSEM